MSNLSTNYSIDNPKMGFEKGYQSVENIRTDALATDPVAKALAIEKTKKIIDKALQRINENDRLKIIKIMFDQNEQSLGKPSSDIQKILDNLKKEIDLKVVQELLDAIEETY